MTATVLPAVTCPDCTLGVAAGKTCATCDGEGTYVPTAEKPATKKKRRS